MKKILLLLATCITLLIASVWFIGDYLAKSVNQPISVPDQYKSVIINTTHGSFLDANNRNICALLMHRLRANRMIMMGRAEFLQSQGISSLLIDLQAHGETLGEQITFGYRESANAHDGVNYLKQQSCKKIIAIGHSLGGASALLGEQPIDVDALVLESVYPTIEQAVENRLTMRLGSAGKLLAPLLYSQIPFKIHAPIHELRPIEKLRLFSKPVFIIGGAKDEHTTLGETQAMYDAVHAPKKLWVVDDAAHIDFYADQPNKYQHQIMQFINAYVVNSAITTHD